ncbi:hypothetical protein ABZ851_27110 [Streptomyces sp. NPDC047049]|uniref:hypothetical protein n=1 Tax=Streptomyces sp. NPDC047049 TaxID=3156688 RepID=UPI0033E60A1C
MVEAAVPEFARRVRERFGAYRHHVLATLRKDGGPRLTGRYAAVAKPPEPFHLFRAELTEVLHTSTEDPYVVLESWAPGRPLRTIRRTSDDATLRVG